MGRWSKSSRKFAKESYTLIKKAMASSQQKEARQA